MTAKRIVLGLIAGTLTSMVVMCVVAIRSDTFWWNFQLRLSMPVLPEPSREDCQPLVEKKIRFLEEEAQRQNVTIDMNVALRMLATSDSLVDDEMVDRLVDPKGITLSEENRPRLKSQLHNYMRDCLILRANQDAPD